MVVRVYHRKKYGPMPFGQPVMTLITKATHIQFGHGKQCPWLTLHRQGNQPRNHQAYPNLEDVFRLEDPYPNCLSSTRDDEGGSGS
jgi:hypothetical protein